MKFADNTSSLCRGTPSIGVVDNRGKPVRVLRYNRTAGEQALDELITHSVLRDDGLQSSLWDARLFTLCQADASQVPNLLGQLSLSGQTLRSDSVDAGWSVKMYDAEGRLKWSKDGRGSQRRFEFDTLGRAVAVFERVDGEDERAAERLIYGDNGNAQNPQGNNMCGQLVRHYDEAGLISSPGFTLLGAPTGDAQQFLTDAEQQSDWQGDDENVWQSAMSGETYFTAIQYDATGARTRQIDAKGNQQRFAYDVAGAQCQSFLTISGAAEQILLKEITYSAADQLLQETAGNDVATDYAYEPQTQRLLGITTTRPVSGSRSTQLQDLRYQYDPVGNILSISNGAAATRYFRNQEVAAQNSYTYDALYQLLSASGRENTTAGQQGPSLPDAAVDTANVRNYTRNYIYDRGGNLFKITHAAGNTSYTNTLFVDAYSNRALAQDLNGGITQSNINSFFDSCGNVTQMQPGTPLIWNVRNQLQSIALLDRGGAANANDREIYQYRGSVRVRKQTRRQTNVAANIWRVDDVIYLPGLELRTTSTDSNGAVTVNEALQVMTVAAAGRAGIRVLHWDNGKPEEIANDQLRYSFDDHIGSSLLELDNGANILTQEEYYPYGGTAVLTAKSDSEAKYKVVRYSGKERDGAGLYYYGYRYYAPWLCRWMSPDPAGMVDGPNIYCMVKNNPVSYRDRRGADHDEIKMGRYRREVGLREKVQLISADLSGAVKLEKFDFGKHKFKASNDYKLVQVDGNLKYGFTHSELVNTLAFYRQEYAGMSGALVGVPSEGGKSAIHNFKLGVSVTEGFMRDVAASEEEGDDEFESYSRATSSTFVLMPREDKDFRKEDRYKRVIGVVGTIYDDYSKEIFIHRLVAHPYTQAYRAGMSEAEVERAGSYKQVRQFNVKAVGKFVTFKLLKRYFKDVSIKSFITEAINPRSAAIAIKFGMRYDGGSR
jgi:insecticidal toxin complex protein TccC